jgi:hypothetical protein
MVLDSRRFSNADARAYNIQYAPNSMQGARRSNTTQTTVLKLEFRTQWQSG